MQTTPTPYSNESPDTRLLERAVSFLSSDKAWVSQPCLASLLLSIFCLLLSSEAIPEHRSAPQRKSKIENQKSKIVAPITALAFSPDGKSLLSGGYKMVVVQTMDGKIARTLPCNLSKIHDLAFSPDGKTLAVGGGMPGASGTALVFQWPAGTLQQTLSVHSDTVNAIAFSPDGKLLATASADKNVILHRSGANGKFQRHFTLIGHTGPVSGLAFSPNGKTLVTASADRSLKVWDTETAKLLRTLTNHTAEIHCVVFRPQTPDSAGDSPAVCASGSEDKTVRVWMPEIGRMVRIVRNHEGATLALAFSQDGKTLFSAGTEGIIRAIDAESDTILRAWKAHNSPIYSLTVSPDGKTLASGDWSGTIRSGNVTGGQKLH